MNNWCLLNFKVCCQTRAGAERLWLQYHSTDLERSFEAVVFAEGQVRELTSAFAPSSAAQILSRKETTEVELIYIAS
jgi:hypothetical protein